MATTKINTPELFELESSTSGVRLPNGTTAQRPSTNLNAGDFRFNTDDNKVEYYDGSNWFQIDDESLPPVPSENFNTVLYAGNGSTQSITGVGFQPDFVWIKERNGTEWHNLFDSVRGADKSLYSNETTQEVTSSTKITSFDTDGFSLGSDNNVNKSASIYVAWCWKAGGGANTYNINGTGYSTRSAAGLTSGSIADSKFLGCSTNTAAGFSIIRYDAAGASAGQTIDTGLTSDIELMIIKRTDSTGSWVVVDSITNKYHFLNTSAQGTSITFSDYVSGTLAKVYDFATYVHYCFHSVDGYQKIGSYTGNGNTNGTIVNTGFEPAFLMIKRSDGVGSWYMYDNKRTPSNVRDSVLQANEPAAEVTNTYANLYFLTNGFQLRTTNGEFNGNGSTYLYLAFASDPTSTTPSLANSFKTNLYTGNGATQTIGGHLNGAAQFNGSSSEINITGQLPSSVASDYAVSCWVNPNALSSSGHALFTNLFAGGAYATGQAAILIWNSKIRLYLSHSGTSNTYVYDSGNDVPTGLWSNIVVNIDVSAGTSSIITAYLNGAPNNLTYLAATNVGPNENNNTVFGKFQGISFYDGSIDQVRIYSSALTSSQARELYNETSATANTLNFPTGAGCVAAYPLDSNSADLSTNFDGADTSITYSEGTSTNPSLVWIKNRDDSADHRWFDTIRGATYEIASNSTSTEDPITTTLTAFNKNGFTVGSLNDVNGSNDDIVAWNWGASTLPTANGEGTIPSTVCVNDAAGFSTVSYTGNGSAGTTIGHGLTSAPELIIVKTLDSIDNWMVLSTAVGATKKASLNATNEFDTDSAPWNDTAPTPTVFTVGTKDATNKNGDRFIAYCFKSIEGYSEIGTYQGTGQVGNAITFAGAGFEPGWIMIKATDAAEPWFLLDAKRNPTNPRNDRLMADSDASESPNSVHTVDFNSNGFTANGTLGDGTNGLNKNYLYFAIK